MAPQLHTSLQDFTSKIILIRSQSQRAKKVPVHTTSVICTDTNCMLRIYRSLGTQTAFITYLPKILNLRLFSEVCEDWHEYCWNQFMWPGPESCSWYEVIPNGCPAMCGLCSKLSFFFPYFSKINFSFHM